MNLFRLVSILKKKQSQKQGHLFSKYFLCLLCLFGGLIKINAQELQCNVTINSAKIQGSNKNRFNTLQASVTEFMNGTKWTDALYTDQERIDCSLLLTIREASGNRYVVSVQVQSRRPVFGSAYQSMMLNLIDEDVEFDYVEFDRIEFDLKTFRSNLSSVLAFYAYYIIGLDNDSFALKGGTECYENAQQIVSNAQKESFTGWNPYENANRKNRYWLVDNMINSQRALMRSCYYRYHRLGLDELGQNQTKARGVILSVLTDLQSMYTDRQDNNLHYLRVFFDAKSDELVNIFQEAPIAERTQAMNILLELDMLNSKKYNKLKETEASKMRY